MAESQATSKNGENTLGLIGSLTGIAGKLIFGPDFDIDLGSPFKMGASMLKDRREEQNLLKLLQSTPQTSAIAEMAPAVMEAGGLVNNLDLINHPEVQQVFGGKTLGPSFSGAANPNELMGPQSIPMAPSPAANIPLTQPNNGLLSLLQGPTTSSIDVTSQPFLEKAAQYRPDIAEKVLTSRMGGTSSGDSLKDLLQTVLLGKQINAFETPEEKRRAALEDKSFMQTLTDQLIRARTKESQENSKRLDREKVTPKEAQEFATIDELRGQYRNMLGDVEAGVKPDALKNAAATFLPYGDRVMQAVDPSFALFRKNVEASLAIYQKAISGVAVPEAEARRLRPTQPQAGDNPASFKAVADNNLKKANELYFIKALSIAQRGGDTSQYIPADQLQMYKAVREAMNYNLKEALANPRVQQIRQQLGIDYSAGNINK